MSNIEDYKFCVNCYHCFYQGSVSYFCLRPVGIDLVTGVNERSEELCKNERNSDEPDKCSKEARFFREKVKK